MYELSILKSFLNKDNYIEYRNYVDNQDLEKQLHPVLNSIDLWYKNNSESPCLEDIANLTFAGGIPAKDQEYLKSVFDNLARVNGQESVLSLLERFKTTRLCEDISVASYEASRGSKSVSEVLSLVDKLREPEIIQKVDYITDDLHEILQDTVVKPGLRWRLNSLNRALGSLRKGDFGFIFARPETGKTTFLADQVTHMASQLGPEDGPIIWFNNEEQGKKVKYRCYQAALQAKKDYLLRHTDEAIDRYRSVTNGKLLIKDESYHRREIEAIIAKEKPSLIIFDQIDKVRGFKDDRLDIELGALYQWARELAKQYCPVIGVCQADGSGEGVKWLNMGHVANAKTSKQAEADFILGIGKSNERGFDYFRYFNISKNKLTGDTDSDPEMRHAQIEVIIKPEVARYDDIG